MLKWTWDVGSSAGTSTAGLDGSPVTASKSAWGLLVTMSNGCASYRSCRARARSSVSRVAACSVAAAASSRRALRYAPWIGSNARCLRFTSKCDTRSIGGAAVVPSPHGSADRWLAYVRSASPHVASSFFSPYRWPLSGSMVADGFGWAVSGSMASRGASGASAGAAAERCAGACCAAAAGCFA